MELFTEEERDQYRSNMHQTKDKHEFKRLCSLLSYDSGISVSTIASVLQLSERVVFRYISDFKKHYKAKHSAQGGSNSKLTDAQTQGLKSHLKEKTYLYVKDIVSYVSVNYNIRYSISGMCCWLKQPGFCYKKPATVPGKMDPDKQKAFQNQYHALKEQLKQDEIILFMDGVHPSYQSQSVGGWMLKSEKRYLPTTGKQSRLHFMAALSTEKYSVFIEEFKTINADSILNFLKLIEASYTTARKIYIICDNAAYHKEKYVKDYLQDSRLMLIYLPGYSPNLNPIERLWKLMRKGTIYNKYYEKFSDFTQAVRGFFNDDTNRLKQLIAKSITDKFNLFVPKLIST